MAAIYSRRIGLEPSRTKAEDLIVDVFVSPAGANAAARVEKLLDDKPFNVEKVKQRRATSLLFRQPSVLLTYLMAKGSNGRFCQTNSALCSRTSVRISTPRRYPSPLAQTLLPHVSASSFAHFPSSRPLHGMLASRPRLMEARYGPTQTKQSSSRRLRTCSRGSSRCRAATVRHRSKDHDQNRGRQNLRRDGGTGGLRAALEKAPPPGSGGAFALLWRGAVWPLADNVGFQPSEDRFQPLVFGEQFLKEFVTLLRQTVSAKDATGESIVQPPAKGVRRIALARGTANAVALFRYNIHLAAPWVSGGPAAI